MLSCVLTEIEIKLTDVHIVLARLIGILEHIPWMVGLLNKLVPPGVEQTKYFEFRVGRYELRKKQGSGRRDLFHYIVSIHVWSTSTASN